MKLSTIFRKAAKRRRAGFSCCYAIEEVTGNAPVVFRAIHYFSTLFKPDGNCAAFYFDYADGYTHVYDYFPGNILPAEEAANRRRLALLLAAEVAESEGR